MKYVLITSARNEEAFVGLTLASVAAQTQLPERWVITDDGSSDCTAEIVAEFAKKCPWITLIRNPKREGRNFGAKADAVNAALNRCTPLHFSGGMGDAVAGRPIAIRFVDDRTIGDKSGK